jgi:hypothetical protein
MPPSEAAGECRSNIGNNQRCRVQQRGVLAVAHLAASALVDASTEIPQSVDTAVNP